MGSIDDAFGGLWGDLGDAAADAYAKEVAKVARDEGLKSADSIQIEIDESAAKLGVSADDVRRRANAILAAG